MGVVLFELAGELAPLFEAHVRHCPGGSRPTLPNEPQPEGRFVFIGGANTWSPFVGGEEPGHLIKSLFPLVLAWSPGPPRNPLERALLLFGELFYASLVSHPSEQGRGNVLVGRSR